MAKKKQKPQEPDIYEIRQQQSRTALGVARAIDPDAYIGELNDTFFYLVTKDKGKVKGIADALMGQGIETRFEYEEISEENLLYLLDEKKGEETDGEISMPEMRGRGI